MTNTNAAMLTIRDVCDLVQCGRTTIYRWVQAGTFPAGHKLGPNAIRWRRTDVLAWLADRTKAHQAAAGADPSAHLHDAPAPAGADIRVGRCRGCGRLVVGADPGVDPGPWCAACEPSPREDIPHANVWAGRRD